ncbi:MAG: MFS family permease [Paracrocinitomix sp.]
MLAATFVTNLGDGLRLPALPLLISGIAAALFLPWTTFAPFGGVIVDRADRRRLIMITQAWRSLVMAALGLAIVTDVLQIWHIFVVAFVITVGEILVDPSVTAMVPTLVAHKDLDRANSRISTVEIVTNNFAGGPIGAASFTFVPGLLFLLEALSYLGPIAPFSRLPAARTRPDPSTPAHRCASRWVTDCVGSSRTHFSAH